MKIVYVSDAIYPYNKGGKEKQIYEITTRLVKHGHSVHIFTMKWWKGRNIKIENGVVLHGACKSKKLYTVSGRRSIWQALYFSSKILLPLLFAKFDIIVVDQVPYFPLFTAKLVTLIKRKKLIASWLEVWGKKYWLEYLGKKGHFGYFIERLSIFLPNHFIAISPLTKDKLISFYNITSDKITYIPPIGIDFERFNNLKMTESSDCIYFGRLLNHKNVDVLVKAVNIVRKLIPAVRCLIIGEGPEKFNLTTLTKQSDLSNNIKFLDFINEEKKLFSYIKFSRVFVFPSTREGFGIAVIEANACGTPVITINHRDNAAKDLVINGENGYVCRLNENEIANKIIEFIRNNPSKFKNQCINTAKKYQWPIIIEQIQACYNQLL